MIESPPLIATGSFIIPHKNSPIQIRNVDIFINITFILEFEFFPLNMSITEQEIYNKFSEMNVFFYYIKSTVSSALIVFPLNMSITEQEIYNKFSEMNVFFLHIKSTVSSALMSSFIFKMTS